MSVLFDKVVSATSAYLLQAYFISTLKRYAEFNFKIMMLKQVHLDKICFMLNVECLSDSFGLTIVLILGHFK